MSHAKEEEVVGAIVVRMTQALFEAYDVRVEPQPLPQGDPDDDVPFTAVIGFTGRAMRGTLVLAPTRKLLQRSHPQLPCEFRDWAAELANQLLGRIKNELLAHGAEIHASTPVTLRGHYLSSVPRGQTSLRCFAASPGNVSVWFDAELNDEAPLGPRQQRGPLEGETILF